MANKRITALTEKSALGSGDFVAVDNATGGTKKFNLFSALSGIASNIGNLSNLQTTEKSNLVGAINEAAQSGGGGGSSITVDDELSSSSTNPVQNKVIKAALDAKAASSAIPAAATNTPAALGTAAVGSSTKYAKEDHVHQKPTASDLGITVPAAATATPSALGTAAVGSSSKYAKEDHVHAMPTAANVGAEPAVTEVTNTSTGSVSLALDAGKIYHFTGSITALTITLTATSGVPHYHFDFISGSTAATLTLPSSVKMPDSFQVEASKRYEIDILDGYGVAQSWAVSSS